MKSLPDVFLICQSVSGTLYRLQAQGKLNDGLDKQDCDEEDGELDLAAEDGDVNLASGGMDEQQNDENQDDVDDCDDEDEKVNAYTLFD